MSSALSLDFAAKESSCSFVTAVVAIRHDNGSPNKNYVDAFFSFKWY
jgi:hypothetical protein